MLAERSEEAEHGESRPKPSRAKPNVLRNGRLKQREVEAGRSRVVRRLDVKRATGPNVAQQRQAEATPCQDASLFGAERRSGAKRTSPGLRADTHASALKHAEALAAETGRSSNSREKRSTVQASRSGAKPKPDVLRDRRRKWRTVEVGQAAQRRHRTFFETSGQAMRGQGTPRLHFVEARRSSERTVEAE